MLRLWATQYGTESQRSSRISMARMLGSPRGATEYENPSKLEIRKNTKKMQNPPFRKNTEKLQKWPFSHRFCNFSVFFPYFRGPTRNGGFCIFFIFFSYFQFWGVSYSVAPRGDPNTNVYWWYVPGILWGVFSESWLPVLVCRCCPPMHKYQWFGDFKITSTVPKGKTVAKIKHRYW